jgi:hypothetical protein
MDSGIRFSGEAVKGATVIMGDACAFEINTIQMEAFNQNRHISNANKDITAVMEVVSVYLSKTIEGRYAWRKRKRALCRNRGDNPQDTTKRFMYPQKPFRKL